MLVFLSLLIGFCRFEQKISSYSKLNQVPIDHRVQQNHIANITRTTLQKYKCVIITQWFYLFWTNRFLHPTKLYQNLMLNNTINRLITYWVFLEGTFYNDKVCIYVICTLWLEALTWEFLHFRATFNVKVCNKHMNTTWWVFIWTNISQISFLRTWCSAHPGIIVCDTIKSVAMKMYNTLFIRNRFKLK